MGPLGAPKVPRGGGRGERRGGAEPESYKPVVAQGPKDPGAKRLNSEWGVRRVAAPRWLKKKWSRKDNDEPILGKPRKVDSPKRNVEKPQDGRQKSSQNIGNPYQMEDNKAAPSAPPQGGGASRRPLGVLVVFHLVKISDVLA